MRGTRVKIRSSRTHRGGNLHGSLALFLLVAGAVAPRLASGQEVQPDETGYVLEKLATEATFEEDGRGSVRSGVRVRVVSEAGVQALGLLTFSYNAETEVFRLEKILVEKPDGSILKPPAEGVQDRAAAVDPETAIYTDLREVHVAVPRLRPGDLLEYETHTRLKTPVAPGQFWLEHDFEKGEVVLEEVLVVRVPAGTPIRLFQQPPYEAEVVETAEHRVYRWSAASPKPLEDKELLAALIEPPAIQLSSFDSWVEVGAWYDSLADQQAKPVPAVRAKALELTAGMERPIDRVKALYRFVSSQIRYVSLSFGIGRYQPHPAAEVLQRGFGDCKDKHTLLAALLAAVDLESDPVLIHSWRDLTEELPSPAQFDHLITLARVDDQTLWLDTTPQVAPFGLLSRGLRGKKALRASAGRRSAVLTVPKEEPFDSFVRVSFEGRLTAFGDLRGKFRMEARGDTELNLRTAFLPTPRAGWKELARWLLVSQGLAGEISNLRVTEPMQTEIPFKLECDVKLDSFGAASGGRDRLSPPLSVISLPEWPEMGDAEPLDLHEALDVTTSMTLSLPVGVEARAPLDVHLTRAYGSYRSRYKVKEGVIEAHRSLRLLNLAIPSVERPSYESLWRTVAADRDQVFTLDWKQAEAIDPAGVDDVEELERAAETAMGAERYGEAAALLERLESLSPEHPTAWLQLGLVYTQLGRIEEAETLLRRRLEGAPADSAGHVLLGEALLQQGRAGEAVDVLRRRAAAAPLEASPWSGLGFALYLERRFAEAIDALERALSLEPDDLRALAVLGACYLFVDRTDDGVETLLRAQGTTDRQVLESVAGVAIEHGQYSVARQLLRRLTSLDPNHPRGWFALAVAQVGESSPDLALESVGRHLEIAPADERAQALKAMLGGEASEMIELVQRQGDLDEQTRASVLIEAAQQLLLRSQDDKAKELIEEALALSNAEMIQVKAAYLLASWRLDLSLAEEHATAALGKLVTSCSRLSLDSPPAMAEPLLFGLGMAWYTVGWVAFMNTDLDQAIEYLEPTLWLAPQAETAETIAQIYELKKDQPTARRFFALALSLPGEAPSARQSLASLVEGTDVEEAISRARAARQLELRIELDNAAVWTGEEDVLLRLDSRGAVLGARSMSGNPRVQRNVEAATGESFTLSVPGGRPDAFLIRALLRCARPEEACTLSLVTPKSALVR